MSTLLPRRALIEALGALLGLALWKTGGAGAQEQRGDPVSMDVIGPSLQSAASGAQVDGTRAFWVDPVDSQLIIAGTWSNGVWVSRDCGRHWYQEAPATGPGNAES